MTDQLNDAIHGNTQPDWAVMQTREDIADMAHSMGRQCTSDDYRAGKLDNNAAFQAYAALLRRIGRPVDLTKPLTVEGHPEINVKLTATAPGGFLATFTDRGHGFSNAAFLHNGKPFYDNNPYIIVNRPEPIAVDPVEEQIAVWRSAGFKDDAPKLLMRNCCIIPREGVPFNSAHLDGYIIAPKETHDLVPRAPLSHAIHGDGVGPATFRGEA